MFLKIAERKIKVCFEVLSDKTLRIAILPAEESVKEVFSTYDLAERTWGEPSTAISDIENEEIVEIGNFEVSITPDPMCFKIFKNQKQIQNITVCQKTGNISFPLGKGLLFGLGHGYKKHMDRKGEYYDLRVNGQVKGIIENGSATSPTPYVISTEGWALYFHQPWKGAIDLRGKIGVFEKYPPFYCDIFVVACDEPLDASREYYKFTGLPPIPPKYAFGYQQSYRTLVHNGKNYVLETAKYMRDNQIPCDVLIYLGTGYCEYGWNTYNGNFEWHPDVFPNPEQTMEELHNMNYKIGLHITKCYPGLHGSVKDEEVNPLEYDHVKNYWELHEELYATAKNEMWWPDDGDEIDIIQRLNRHRLYYEGSLQLNPDVRPFHMQRNTFPGANKWGGIIWSGDVLSEWETLKNQIPIGLNASISCSPFWGTDTGGFFSTEEFDGELFMRWVEFSTFTPFFRAHGRPSFLHNPWGWTMFKSLDEIPLEIPSNMPESKPPLKNILPDERVEPVCKKYINLRYELLPYIYNLAYQASHDGIPMMRPMWYKYPHDETAAKIDNQFFLGDSLLVAPVTSKGKEEWTVYLPSGKWYDFWTGNEFNGNKYVTVPAPYDVIPVFVPAGGILAKAPVVQYVDTHKKGDFDPLTIVVYAGADGHYTLYEDDGISMGYKRGECTITEFKWDDKAGIMEAKGSSTMFKGKTRTIKLIIMPEGRTENLVITY